MSRSKSSGDGGRRGTQSVGVDYDDGQVSGADQPVVKQNVSANDTDEHPLDDFLLLIAKLAAKRWYRWQAEQHATSQVHLPTKEPLCESDDATPIASVSPTMPLVTQPIARRKK